MLTPDLLPEFYRLRNLAHAEFTKHGWEAGTVICHPAFAYSPNFHTVTGGRYVVVWFRSGDEYNIAVLSGEFTSQGRNVLSTCNQLFQPGDGEEVVAGKVAQFIADVTRNVEESYAIRLAN